MEISAVLVVVTGQYQIGAPITEMDYQSNDLVRELLIKKMAQKCNGGPYLVMTRNYNKVGRYFHSNV